jgi:hypothetical protein
MTGMTREEHTLETAARALHDAQEAVHAARRNLTAAIVAAYQGGEPAARIAMRTGKDITGIRNLLAAARASRRRYPQPPKSPSRSCHESVRNRGHVRFSP